jgi:predicted nucleic acid-binding protein
VEIVRSAEELLAGRELAVDSAAVLDLAFASSCSAYDCEFVALAQALGVRLVTSDKQVLRAFPRIAKPLIR